MLLDMYVSNPGRYDEMPYRRAGTSGLKLSALSLGFWHNFGAGSDFEEMKRMVFSAFDGGITCFDLANNYGPPAGSAEENFGAILKSGLSNYRDELVISTKAGHEMWSGPYGNWGSRKHIIASLDCSLKRLGLDYVDIFYHHRPDPETPLEETMDALAYAVRSGKAIYVALSKYPPELLRKAKDILERSYNIHPLVNQIRYSMLDRRVEEEEDIFTALRKMEMSAVVFSPLAQGLLTDKYLLGIVMENTRAKENRFLKESIITPEMVTKLNALNKIASRRGQSLSEMALSFVLRHDTVASVIIGARNADQVKKNILAIGKYMDFSPEELAEIRSYAI